MPGEFPLTSGALIIRSLPYGTGLVLAGEADLTGQAALAAALAPLPASGTGEICLDLTGLRFIDVACARELIGLAGRHPGVRVIVRNPPRCLRRITALLNPHAPLEFSGTPQPGPRLGRRTPAAALATTVPPSRPQPPQALYVTSDAEAAEHVLSSAYGTLRIDARGRGGGMRLAQASLSSSVRFDHVSFSMCFDVTATPQGALPIGHLRSG